MQNKPRKHESIYSATIYRSATGLPSVMVFGRTGTSGEYWEPIINHRIQDHAEIMYIMGGSGRIAVKDVWFDARKHQVFFIAPSVPLDLMTQEKNKLDLLYAHFKMQSDHDLRRVVGPRAYIIHEIESYDDEAYLNMLALPDQLVLPPDNPVLKYLSTAFDVYSAKTIGYYQEACLHLLGALHQLASLFVASVSQPAEGPRGIASALARRVRSYIIENITSFSGMNELSKTFKMNSQHLSRVFTKIYGESIVSFVNRLRIDLAKKFLLTTDKNVSTIAKASGFTSTSHFHRVFKKEAGLSATEFRTFHSIKTTPAIAFSTPFDYLAPGKELSRGILMKDDKE